MSYFISDNFFHEMYGLMFDSPLVWTFIAGIFVIVYQYYVKQQRRQQLNVPNSEMALWSSVNLNPPKDILISNYNIKQRRRTSSRTAEANSEINVTARNSGNKNSIPSRSRENSNRAKRKKLNDKSRSEKTGNICVNLSENVETKTFVKEVKNSNAQNCLNAETKILNTDDFESSCFAYAIVEKHPVVLNINVNGRSQHSPVDIQGDAMGAEFDAGLGSTQVLACGNFNFDEGLEIYTASSPGEIASTSTTPDQAKISCVNKKEIFSGVCRNDVNSKVNFQNSSDTHGLDNEVERSSYHCTPSSGAVPKKQIKSVNYLNKNENSSKLCKVRESAAENFDTKNVAYFDGLSKISLLNVPTKEQSCLNELIRQKSDYEITDFSGSPFHSAKASADAIELTSCANVIASASSYHAIPSTSSYDVVASAYDMPSSSLAVAFPSTSSYDVIADKQVSSVYDEKKLCQPNRSFQITDAASKKCVGTENNFLSSQIQQTLMTAVSQIQLMNSNLQELIKSPDPNSNKINTKEASSSHLYKLSSSTGAISKRKDCNTAKKYNKENEESGWDHYQNLVVDLKIPKQSVPNPDCSSTVVISTTEKNHKKNQKRNWKGVVSDDSTVVENQQSSESAIDEEESYSCSLERRVRKLVRILKVPDTAEDEKCYKREEIVRLSGDRSFLESFVAKIQKKATWSKIKNKLFHAKHKIGATVSKHFMQLTNFINAQSSAYGTNTEDTNNLVYDTYDEAYEAEADGGTRSSMSVVDQDLCIGCDEVFADSVYFPCGHSYLCYPCAQTVSQIYKRCCVCNETIDSIQRLGS